ncbi:hypothetical protein IAQ61_005577 [Plenodomus lingam]|uniref:Predicted protein n=1 Tax=Leptosphaeria maculans (strain JN3 / isolate v23.1.3 / race Av1-4-5-6-7-8) TaxID=985895 RepID=E4ZYN1_LEPMJ|nr:predicted protein [Plenodomus lingam JN3]KAH9871398.1 hypothetical protein IAQ61_005577 [Plenodomus lingam]CBX96557.1 predicted protein [Plenodomus lingam JN3]
MSFLRTTTLRASTLARAARQTPRYLRTAELQPWQRAVQRRTYASAHEGGAHAKTSDMPWAIGAVVGTAVGLYIVVNQDTSGGHHEDHGDDHAEKHHEEEAPAEDESTEEESKTDAEDDSKDDAKTETKDNSKDEKTDESNEDIKGAAGNSEEKDNQSPDKSDIADPRKAETKSQNETSGKQRGLSNDDTHHTSQIAKQPEKSKKGEGVAESAKLQGTVSTDRPGAENKEERGKSHIDKDA